MHGPGEVVTRKQQILLLIAVVWIAAVAATAYITHSLAFVGGLLGLLGWALLPFGKSAGILGEWRDVWITITATLATMTWSLVAGRLLGLDKHLTVATSCGLGIFVGLLVNYRNNISAN